MTCPFFKILFKVNFLSNTFFHKFLLAIAETEGWQGTQLVGHPPHRVSFVLACK